MQNLDLYTQALINSTRNQVPLSQSQLSKASANIIASNVPKMFS